MAAPEFEGMRPNSDLFVEISRILERLIKESKCVDLEALCIISGEQTVAYCRRHPSVVGKGDHSMFSSDGSFYNSVFPTAQARKCGIFAWTFTS